MRWSNLQQKSVFRRLIEFGEIKPVAIDIIQTDGYDKKCKICIGEKINRWVYDRKGCHCVPLDENNEGKILETCTFCIDKEQKKLLVVWANILSSASSRRRIHYFQTGTLYELTIKNGVEDYDITSSWIE
jgi:hypothetical protein